MLGLYAIKCVYLKQFAYDGLKSPECEFAEYVNKNVNRCMELHDLHVFFISIDRGAGKPTVERATQQWSG